MSWWVGGYIEAGAGGSGTPYLPFVFQDASKAQAQKDAGAKLLAGPFSTQSAAQNWANAYEKNPNTLHAGSDIPAGPGQPFNGGGSGPGGTGASKGDTPPNPSTILGLPTLSNLQNLMIRVVKVVGGLMLVFIGLNRLSKETTNIDFISSAKGAAKLGALA